MQNYITATYENLLQGAYHVMQKRGIHVNTAKLQELRKTTELEIQKNLSELEIAWHQKVSIGASKGCYNIRSNQQLKALLKEKGFKLPLIPPTKAQRDSGEEGYKESVSKLPLQLLLAKTGDVGIKKLLTIAELVTLKSRYINARLYDYFNEQSKDTQSLYLASYNVAGTLTGRRSSKKNIFGFGGNAQNFPKHTKSAEAFLDCLVPRPGHVFLFVDQKSAEEWPVSALCHNLTALKELQHGVDRHTNLAAFVFGVPASSISKKDIKRYLGKKSRHANNYGMQCERMSLSLAQEGFFMSKQECQVLLEKVNTYDPSVRQVFHKYIETEIDKKRFLKTPFGRERYFGAFRPGTSNKNIYGEAYSYIPQSVVGDNNGFAVLYLESNKVQSDYECQVVQEGHDSITQDVLLDEDCLLKALQNTMKAFDREIDFKTGFPKFKIPVEAELGTSFANTVSLKTLDKPGLIEALQKLATKEGD